MFTTNLLRNQRERLAHPAFLGVYIAIPVLFFHLGDAWAQQLFFRLSP
jgi:hypothetical protein